MSIGDDDWLGPPLPSPELPPRRRGHVTYRLRLLLLGIEPPIWRRVDLSSGLRLSSLHEVLQMAMGWEDSHLHQFQMPPHDGHEVAPFLTQFDVEEGDEGIVEDDVRLDQVLREPGDTIFYLYDYGDSWEHVVELEAISPHDSGGRSARCVGGARACPPEDCGGVPGYDELMVGLRATEPLDEWIQERLDWLGDYDPEAFSVERTDNLLGTL